jgi:hypothetical protein
VDGALPPRDTDGKSFCNACDEAFCQPYFRGVAKDEDEDVGMTKRRSED